MFQYKYVFSQLITFLKYSIYYEPDDYYIFFRACPLYYQRIMLLSENVNEVFLNA